MPGLETSIWEPYQEEGVLVVGVDSGGLFGGDTPEIVSAFVDQTGVTFPIGWDRSSSYNKLHAVAGASISPFPVDVVIAPDGTIAYLSAQYDADALVAAVQALVE